MEDVAKVVSTPQYAGVAVGNAAALDSAMLHVFYSFMYSYYQVWLGEEYVQEAYINSSLYLSARRRPCWRLKGCRPTPR